MKIKLIVEDIYQDLDQHIEFKNKEIKNLRFLAKATLHQKSLIDNFLMESIECAKHGGDEIDMGQEQGTQSHKQTQSDKFKSHRGHPPSPENASNDQSERQYHDSSKLQIGKTELKDLSWEDREKILRVIYAKIALGVNPGYWKRLESEAEKKRRKEEGNLSNLPKQNRLF